MKTGRWVTAAALVAALACAFGSGLRAERMGYPPAEFAARRDFVLVGRCGVPATAAAVSANLTVIPSADGQLRVTPGNQGFTVASAISFRAWTVRANNAVLFLATDGTGTVGVQNDAAGSVDFVLDINGYFE